VQRELSLKIHNSLSFEGAMLTIYTAWEAA
jgi:hypothetical protein